MTAHKTVLFSYYALLVAVVLVQAVSTVYSLSQTMSFGSRVLALHTQQSQLQNQKNMLVQEITAKTAVSQIDTASTSFVAISTVTPLDATAFLASR